METPTTMHTGLRKGVELYMRLFLTEDKSTYTNPPDGLSGWWITSEELIQKLFRLMPFFTTVVEDGQLIDVVDDSVSREAFFNSQKYKELSELQKTPEELAAENKLLKAQLQAQSDRADFIEDCIAEMAVQVYGGV